MKINSFTFFEIYNQGQSLNDFSKNNESKMTSRFQRNCFVISLETSKLVMLRFFTAIIPVSAIMVNILILGCQKLSVKNGVENNLSSSREVASTALNGVVYFENCEKPSFSSSGDQLIFLCLTSVLNNQEQIFTYDIKSAERRRLTYMSGRINFPQFIKSNLVVFTSDTDRKKEVLTLDKLESESEDLFEVYTLNIDSSEYNRLTNNYYLDGFVYPIKNINPKIVFYRKDPKKYQVIQKNLSNSTEKILYSTTNKILEIHVNEQNDILVVEELKLKKSVKWLKSDAEQVLWPEYDNKKFNFYLNADTKQLEYLEVHENETVLKGYDSKNQCEYEIFSIPSTKVTLLKKSPISNQTYAWEEVDGMLKSIQLKSLNFNPLPSCKKTSNLGK